MRTGKAYFMAVSASAHRCGDIAEILGVVTHYPNMLTEAKVCFHLRYGNGEEFYFPIVTELRYTLFDEEHVELSFEKKHKG